LLLKASFKPSYNMLSNIVTSPCVRPNGPAAADTVPVHVLHAAGNGAVDHAGQISSAALTTPCAPEPHTG